MRSEGFIEVEIYIVVLLFMALTVLLKIVKVSEETATNIKRVTAED